MGTIDFKEFPGNQQIRSIVDQAKGLATLAPTNSFVAVSDPYNRLMTTAGRSGNGLSHGNPISTTLSLSRLGARIHK